MSTNISFSSQFPSQKSNIISLVNELHQKLRKIESSCEEGGAASLIGRSSISIASISPTSSGSKFYKNLKKIKRNHGTENPTKNYYLAFPALSSKQTTATTTITSSGSKRSSPGDVVGETNKDSNLQLLCWSSLMTKENSPAKDAVSGLKRPRRKRRYGRYKSAVKNDVQCNAKSKDVATFSPKAQNGSKKHQRNQFGKIIDMRDVVVSSLSPLLSSLLLQLRRQRTQKPMSSSEAITSR